MNTRRKKPREVTGRTVLLSLLAFFGVIIAINAVMVKAATSTFGGVQATSSYKAGLQFKHEIALAEKQDGRHWQVDGKLSRDRGGDAVLDVTVKDSAGAALAGLSAKARLAHPADERQDRVIELERIGAGAFRGSADAHRGHWDLLLDLYQGDERVFRSRSRVTLN